ncbi:hypothetical protein WA026_009981, partial [Henosepilachna vigintioctopunctata]
YGTFDFIVVGAGSTGSIVASRLSEVESYEILLLEAGDFDDDLTDIPYVAHLLQLSDRNWGYLTTPQKNSCFGRKNRQCPYARGKVLGGSGTITGLAYTRGNKGDYDKWKSMGNFGWSFDDLLSYFKKMENFESDSIDRTYRGFGGPLNVAYKIPKQDISELISSASDLGFRYVKDYNAKDQIGISRVQRSTKCGKRVSGSTAYVRPSMNRHNFNLTLKAFVTKIVIDKPNKSAKGVEFIKDGKKYVAFSRKEVIVSGGAVNSPQLLMLSGIGPVDELRKHNIPIIQVLPVGQYMKDHPSFKIYYRSNQTLPKESLRNLLKEYVQGEGMLTNTENTLTYIYMNLENKSSSVPDLEFVLSANTPVPKSIPEASNLKKDIEDYFKNINGQTDYSFQVFVLHPESVGTVTLQSNDPRDFPLIDIAIFENPKDLELIYKATKIFDLLEQATFAKKIDLKRLDFGFCNEFERNSKAYWYCAIQKLAYCEYHMTSTVRMGPRNDPFAVVDNKLKVYGIDNLRVADCSIMPSIVSGHPNSGCFVIGEKVADVVKADHQTS